MDVNGIDPTLSLLRHKLQSISDGTNVRTFAYDDRGRRTEERLNGSLKRTYAWDRDDRLAGIEYSNPPGTPFAGSYGPDGARVGKTDSGGTRTFLRSGPGVTAPVLSDGAATYTPGVSEVRGGLSTFVTGGLKNQDAQWSSAGALMATRTYDPGTPGRVAFGNVVSSSGTWQGPFAPASRGGGAYGYQEDPSGLKLLGHRYYDPSTGSFLSRDPIKDGRNWYAYCGGNPVRFADPMGLWSTGSYLGDVGQVFVGYGDALNPVHWVEGIAEVVDIGARDGAGAAMMAMVQGTLQMLQFWEAEDPRDFGARMGGTLMTAAAIAAPYAGAGAAAASGAAASRAGLLAKLAKPTIMAVGHEPLPKTGPPGGVGARFSQTGKLRQIRAYGDDGVAAVDIDFGHGHGVGDPHYHPWPNGARGGGRPFH